MGSCVIIVADEPRVWGPPSDGCTYDYLHPCYQLDPVRGAKFWQESASGSVQVGIDLLRREFCAPNLVELTEQCRVLDPDFEEHVLNRIRTTDLGPSAAGLAILRSRIIGKAGSVATTLQQMNKSNTELICYCNSQKNDHMRTRARVFASEHKQRLYWSIARDRLCGEGTRRAWASRMSQLPADKVGWLGGFLKVLEETILQCEDSLTLLLCIGLPVCLNDHLNRPKGLVRGLRGVVREIWFDGEPPSQPNSRGEYLCARVPTAVLVKFDGFDELIPVGKKDPSPSFTLASAGTATVVRRMQIPLVPDFGRTAHHAQGATLSSALVDLNIPPSGDPTAAYMRHRDSLYILSEFDASKLRRSGSKAGVDILLQRLRGELADDEEGSKTCLGCSELKRRSEFVPAETGSTRQWNSRDRRCLDCCAKSKSRGATTRYELSCRGLGCGGAKRPRNHFTRVEFESTRPVCRTCSVLRRCRECKEVLTIQHFSREQLAYGEPSCSSCAAAPSNPTNAQRAAARGLRRHKLSWIAGCARAARGLAVSQLLPGEVLNSEHFLAFTATTQNGT
eukprot:gene56868-biopygen83888